MATIAGTVLTYLDQAKRIGPDGEVYDVCEALQQQNQVLDDIHWEEGNLDTGHQDAVRTKLPDVDYRMANEASPTSKSTADEINAHCGILTGWSEVAKEVAERGGKLAESRFSEAKSFFESLNQKFTGKLFYGNGASVPKEFSGFFIRFNSLSGATKQNIVSGGGAGSDNASIVLVGWGPGRVFCIFPKGDKMGIDHEDFGLQVSQDSTQLGGNRLAVYRDRWEWKHGLFIKDWRYVARAPNIDISNLTTESSPANLPKLMTKLWHRMPSHDNGRFAYYMNRTVFEMLDIQLREDVKSGGQLKYEEVFGRVVPTYRGIPIRIVDQLLETEAAVA